MNSGPSASAHKAHSLAPWPIWWPSPGLSSVCLFLSCIGNPKLDAVLRQSYKCQMEVKDHFRGLDAMLVLIQSVQLAFSAARVRCCFVFRWLSTGTPLILFSELLCRQSASSLCCSVRLFHPRGGTSFVFSELHEITVCPFFLSCLDRPE